MSLKRPWFWKDLIYILKMSLRVCNDKRSNKVESPLCCSHLPLCYRDPESFKPGNQSKETSWEVNRCLSELSSSFHEFDLVRKFDNKGVKCIFFKKDKSEKTVNSQIKECICWLCSHFSSSRISRFSGTTIF